MRDHKNSGQEFKGIIFQSEYYFCLEDQSLLLILKLLNYHYSAIFLPFILASMLILVKLRMLLFYLMIKDFNKKFLLQMYFLINQHFIPTHSN